MCSKKIDINITYKYFPPIFHLLNARILRIIPTNILSTFLASSILHKRAQRMLQPKGTDCIMHTPVKVKIHVKVKVNFTLEQDTKPQILFLYPRRQMVVGDQRPPAALERDQGHVTQDVGWAPGPVWTGAEHLTSTRIRSPDGPACSESLYRLQYPGPLRTQEQNILCTAYKGREHVIGTVHSRNIPKERKSRTILLIHVFMLYLTVVVAQACSTFFFYGAGNLGRIWCACSQYEIQYTG